MTLPAASSPEVNRLLHNADERTVDPVHVRLDRAGAPSGPLLGTTFAVKDLFDVAGVVTTAGNPAWAERAGVAADDAPAVTALLQAGSRLIGKTITDELAYSLSGTNVHQGTPANPAAPGRMPGGSSAGSAAAVAGGRCDVALGTDTGGSVRVPASYCGIWGMRPTHGRVPTGGLVPLARSFDTVGWFAASADLLARAGRVLLGDEPPAVAPIRRVVVADDLVDLADDGTRAPIEAAASALADAAGIGVDHARVVDSEELEVWLGAFRTIQGAEAWAAHAAFVSTGPPMGPGVSGRFRAASQVSVGQLATAVAVRERARRRVEQLTHGGVALVFPSAATPAPVLDIDRDAKDDLRHRTLLLTCVAGLAGAPAVSAPLGTLDGLPLGVCVAAAPWHDERLLDLLVGVSATDG